MAKKKLYEYQGEMYTLQDFSEMYGVPVRTIAHRLYSGWKLEKAIMPQKRPKKGETELPQEFANGNIVKAIFPEPLSSVFAHLQPKRNKEYVVEARECYRAAPCYLITLESGTRLIVYPDEF